jgi:tyrosine-protein kinase Etk/Wzc
MQKPYNRQHEEEADFKKLFLRYFAYKYYFLVSIILGLVIAFMINALTETVYQVKSTLLIKEDRTVQTLMGGVNPRADIFNRTNYSNVIGILESFSLIDSVLSQLDVQVTYYEKGSLVCGKPRVEIYKNSPFKVRFDKNHAQPFNEPFTLKIIDENWFEINASKGFDGFDENKQFFFGQEIRGETYSFVIERTGLLIADHKMKAYQFIINDPNRLTRTYQKRLTIEEYNLDASILTISFQATNLQIANDFVDMLTSTFIRQNLHLKNQIAQNTVDFIENQLVLTSNNLAASEGKLQSFREEQQLVNIGLISSQLLNDLQELDKQRSIEDVKRRYYDFLLEYITDKRDFREVFAPSALGINDPLLSNHLQELNNLHTERSRLLLTTTERSPSVIAIDQGIKHVKAILEENLKSIKAASSILMSDLNQRIERIERRIEQLPRTERELMGLQRMFNITDATYNFLLEKQAEAGIALASNMPDHRILDHSYFDVIISPKEKFNYTLAFLLGLILPLGTLIIRDYFSTKINSKEEVMKALNLPFLGFIPRYRPSAGKGNVDVTIFDQPFSPVTEAFRTIRLNLNFFALKSTKKLIAVTSIRPGEGKTFTAINLASVIATSNKPVLYIDADIRKTQPNRLTEHMIDVGLSNFLIGQADIDDIINPSSYHKDLFILNSGIISPNPAELLESEAMLNMLQDELNQYDYVIIDTPPVGMVADAIPVLKKADMSIFVVRHNFSRHQDLDHINEIIQKADLKNVVITINDVRHNKKGFGYEYGYGYGLGYGYHTKNSMKTRKGILKA